MLTVPLQESEVVDLCLGMRRVDLELTEEQQRASDVYVRIHARRLTLVLNTFGPLLSPKLDPVQRREHAQPPRAALGAPA